MFVGQWRAYVKFLFYFFLLLSQKKNVLKAVANGRKMTQGGGIQVINKQLLGDSRVVAMAKNAKN